MTQDGKKTAMHKTADNFCLPVNVKVMWQEKYAKYQKSGPIRILLGFRRFHCKQQRRWSLKITEKILTVESHDLDVRVGHMAHCQIALIDL